jgi:hypothetical protein
LADLSIDIPHIPKVKKESLSIKSTYVSYIADHQKVFKPEKNIAIKKDIQHGYDKWFNEF